MRERLVAAFVAFAVAALALLAIPRAYQTADLVQTQEQRKVDRSADLAVVLVREKLADERPVTPQLLDAMLHVGEHLQYVAADGTRTTSTEPHDVAAGDLVARRVLPGGGSVTLSRSGDLVEDRVAQALLPLVLIVIFLVLLSAAAGWTIARRMARPFQRLAAAAQQLGTGDLDLDLPSFRVPEAEKIGVALRTSARQIDELLAHERQVAVHASHELRTPITALRLELEDVALWPQTPPEVAQELTRSLTELDRLAAAVSNLLDRSESRRQGAESEVDLVALVAGAVDRSVSRSGTTGAVRQEQAAPVPARLDRATVGKVLDLLLADACSRPDARVTVAAADAGTHLEVTISSTGPDRREEATPAADDEGTLRSARDLAASLGGQVMSSPTSVGGTVVLRLPKHGPAHVC
jgi:signal transduction histidine kinase